MAEECFDGRAIEDCEAECEAECMAEYGDESYCRDDYMIYFCDCDEEDDDCDEEEWEDDWG